MLARGAVRLVSSSARALAEAAAAGGGAATELRVTIALPSKALVSNADCLRVTLPGREGVFGLEKKSPAMLTELGPGLVYVERVDGTKEKFLIPGGFSVLGKNNDLLVTIPEAARADEIDVDRLRDQYAAAQAKRDAAPAGSRERAEAVIVCDTYKAVTFAVGAKH